MDREAVPFFDSLQKRSEELVVKEKERRKNASKHTCGSEEAGKRSEDWIEEKERQKVSEGITYMQLSGHSPTE